MKVAGTKVSLTFDKITKKFIRGKSDDYTKSFRLPVLHIFHHFFLLFLSLVFKSNCLLDFPGELGLSSIPKTFQPVVQF